MFNDLRAGFSGTLRATFTRPRFIVMLALFLGAAGLSMAIYARMVVTDIPIVVIDEDRSALSRTILRYLDATRELRVNEESILLDEAETRMAEGRIAAIVLIPNDLSSTIKKGREATLFLAVDGGNLLSGKTAWRAISKVIQTVSAGTRLTVVKKLGERREKALARALPITISDNTTFNPAVNYAVYLVPALIFFFLHIWLLIMAASLPIAATPRPGTAFQIGERTALFIVALTAGLLFVYGTLPAASITIASSFPVVIGALIPFLLLDIILAAAVAALFSFSAMFSLQVTILLGMLSLMFSGITWPTDMFPLPIAWFSYLIPFTPFAKAIRILLHYPVGITELTPMWTVYAAETAIYLTIIASATGVARLFRRRRKG